MTDSVKDAALRDVARRLSVLTTTERTAPSAVGRGHKASGMRVHHQHLSGTNGPYG
jgi:hypothetical protein